MREEKLFEHLLHCPSEDKWNRLQPKRRAGVLAPLFSIYSKDSAGIGELDDLKLLIDWCKQTGNSIIQLLPMNEVGPVFCPYDSVSSFALESIYLRVKGIKASRPARNVNYAVKENKLAKLREIFSREFAQDREKVAEFVGENLYWLPDFVSFKALKQNFQGLPWYEWPEEFKSRQHRSLIDFMNTHQEEIDFQAWLQYQLFLKFREVKAYAKANGVLIKGDLPILVSRDSADVWSHQEYFKLEFAAGAPPDMYCYNGQRWGMPTYNWEKIAADGYKYLKEKLKYSQNFYDILRIDHVVGLFRIWSIPYSDLLENQGLHGVFDPADEHLWREQGRNLLQHLVENTEMLLCAEDLGVIPKACPEGLWDFGIPGNDVQRWVKDWQVRHSFLLPEEYRFLSVAMLSTHDTTNWAAWWENEAGTVDEALFICKCKDKGIDFILLKDKIFDLKRSGRGRLRWQKSIKSLEVLFKVLGKKKEEIGGLIEMYLNTYQEKEKLWKSMKLKGRMREKCDGEIIASALKITLAARSIFCIENIFDWMYFSGELHGDPYQRRINTPGTVGPQNWSLTLPLSLEELLKHKSNSQIKKMISGAGRV